jgi:hypothetical protein
MKQNVGIMTTKKLPFPKEKNHQQQIVVVL